MISRSPHGQWSSTGAFLLVGAGAAIGLGNVWRFPHLLERYGGAAFLLVYGLALLLLTVPLLTAELMIGRRARANPVAAMRRLALESGGVRAWVLVGWLALVSAIVVMSLYSIIAGWSLAYLFRAAGGLFAGAGPAEIQSLFQQLTSRPERALAWHTIFTLCVAVVVAQGVSGGVERANRFLVPLAWVLLGLLLWWALAFDPLGIVHRLLDPDFAALGWVGVLEAVSQAFFSLSLGLGAMMAYGAYLPEKTRLARVALAVVALDAAFALLAALMMCPLLAATGEPLTPSLGLLFTAMPLALELDVQRLPGVVFYLLLVLLALSSALALLEVLVSWICERFRLARPVATVLAGLLTWSVGLGALLSFNLWRHDAFLGRTVYRWLEWLLLPGTALLICIFVSTIMRDELARRAWGEAAGGSYRVWQFCLKYPARIGLIVVFGYGLGLVEFVRTFW